MFGLSLAAYGRGLADREFLRRRRRLSGPDLARGSNPRRAARRSNGVSLRRRAAFSSRRSLRQPKPLRKPAAGPAKIHASRFLIACARSLALRATETVSAATGDAVSTDSDTGA